MSTDQELDTDKKPELEKKNDDAINSMTARLDQLESSNKRLLEESKAWKSKFQNVKSEVEQRETDQLKENDDFKGLYERKSQEVEDMKGELLSSRKSGLKSTLKYEVARHAKDAFDVDTVIYNLSKKSDSFAYNKEESSWEGVGEAINDLRKDQDYLFSKDKISMETGRPAKVKEKNTEQVIDENPSAALNSLLEKMLA